MPSQVRNFEKAIKLISKAAVLTNLGVKVPKDCLVAKVYYLGEKFTIL